MILTADQPDFLHRLAQLNKREVIIARSEPAALLNEVNLQVGSELGWVEFNHYYLGFDAVASIVRLLEHLAISRSTLTELHRQTPISFRSRFKVSCPWDKMGSIMRELREEPSCNPEAAPEGILLNLNSGRAFILPSADEPELHVSVEALESNQLSNLVSDANRLLRSKL